MISIQFDWICKLDNHTIIEYSQRNKSNRMVWLVSFQLFGALKFTRHHLEMIYTLFALNELMQIEKKSCFLSKQTYFFFFSDIGRMLRCLVFMSKVYFAWISYIWNLAHFLLLFIFIFFFRTYNLSKQMWFSAN